MRFSSTRRSTARNAVASRPTRFSSERVPAGQRHSGESNAGDAARALVQRLSPHVFESLESRIHLSVTRDSSGFTVVTPAADSKIVYVAASGSDSNPGTINAPVKTVEGARAVLNIATAGSGGSGSRNNVPDQILFRRGDTFFDRIDNWATSGRSASEPFVIGAYTDPNRPSSERPKIATGINTAFDNQATTSAHPQLNHVYILGIAFEAHNRNYRQPTSSFTISYKEDWQGGTYGINLIGGVSNFHVEDSSFQYFRGGMVAQANNAWGTLGNITVRRSVMADNYAPSFNSTGKYITSEGIYADGIQTLTLEENLFDHNGWTDPAYGNFGTFATIYNHNVYLNINNKNVTVRGNTFANASSHGIQMRPGGELKDNVFIDNPIAISYGYLNGMEKAGGVHGEISGNVIYGGNSINGQPRGWGLEIGNLKPKADGGGTVVKNNIFVNYKATNSGALWPAIHLTYGTNANNPAEGVGVNDLTIESNIVYGWTKAVYINPGFAVGGTTRYAYNNVQFLNNEFQNIHYSPMIEHGPNYSPAQEVWRNNRYDMAGSASSSTPYVKTKSTQYTIAQWQALAEPTAVVQEIAYPNPNVSPASFNGSIGGTSSIDGYLTQARRQSSLFWRTNYRPDTLLNYLKAGFSGQRADADPPTGQLKATSINAGGGATHTFTVTWSDPSGVAPGSIDSGDVQVTGPNGFSQLASLVASAPGSDASQVVATYSIPAPGGAWSSAANGTYSVSARAGQVLDTSGNGTVAALLGTFAVNIVAAAPTASLQASGVAAANAAATLTVTYKVTSGQINASSIDSTDLQILGPNGYSRNARLESISPTGNAATIVAVYKVDPPTGGWTMTNNGLYEVVVRDASVSSASGTPIGEALLGTFTVGVSVPVATASRPDITNYTASPQSITVTYSAASGINAATLDGSDIRVEGPNDFDVAATFVSSTGSGTPGNPLVATYTFQPPAGGFAEVNNGSYFVIQQANQVSSVGGTFVPFGVIGSFSVAIDFAPPASISTTPAVFKPSSQTSLPVTVVFSDASGVNVSSIGTGDVIVTRPDGSLATPILQSVSGSGQTVTATFALSMPGGIDASKMGTYSLRMGGNGVSDIAGNVTPVGQNAGTFNVELDLQPPTIGLSVTDVLQQYEDLLIQVEYSDIPGIDPATIDNDDLRVVGPNGFDRPLELIYTDFPDGTLVYATYLLTAPQGGWLFGDNGQYDIVMQQGQVLDVSGNSVAAGVAGSFRVDVDSTLRGEGVPVDPNPASPGLDELTIQFNQMVSGFDLSDLRFTRDGGGNLLTAAQKLTTTDNITFKLSGLSALTQVSGNYQLEAPENENGMTGQYGSGLLEAVSLSFAIDATPPTFTVNAPDLTSATNAAYKFSVTWTDANAIDTSKLTNGDVRVTGPNGYNVVGKLVSIDNVTNGSPRTATYSVTAPSGGWSTGASGEYQIFVRDNEVTDVSGNYVLGQQIGAFNVNVNGQADTTAPTASIVAVSPNPRTTAVDTLTINFSEVVTGFDLSDLTLTRSGSANLLSSQSLSSANGSSFSLSGLTSVTGTSGVYTLTLKTSGHGITDQGGNDLSGGATTSWTVTAPPPTTPPTVPPAVPLSSGININFQPSAAPTVSGYLVDAGQLYAARNGQTYGWLSDHTAVVFDRNVNGDQLLDTVASVKFQGKWELAVPNGTYTVLVGVGDAAAASTNNVWIEGKNLFNYEGLSANQFANRSINVDVADGKLTLGIGNASSDLVKLDFIQVFAPGSPPASPPPTSPPPTSPPPTSPPPTSPPPTSPPPTVPPTPTFAATGLTLVNADTDTEIGLVTSGQTIQVGSPNINLHAVTSGTIGSVQFLINGQQVKTEEAAPYAIGGDLTPDFLPWSAPLGTHTIKVIPYSLTGLQGEVGTAYEVTLTFVSPTSPPTSPPPTSPPPTSPPPTSPPPTSPPPTSPPPASNTVRVNFQPSGAPAASGYLVDGGATYAAQNGYSYGWTTSHTSMVVDREVNADQTLDTHVGVIAKALWDFAVPNGTYTVKVSVGDAAAATTNNVWVEGKNNIFVYKDTQANEFLTQTTTVNVVDGKLTLGVGGSPTGATRINYVEITGDGLVGTVPPTSPPPTSPPPTSPPPTSPPPTSPPPTSPPPTVPPAPTFAATGLTLVNADTDTEIGLVTSGQTIQVGSPNINLHAVTSGTVGSVQFLVDGLQVNAEETAPYSIGGDAAPDYLPWSAPLGTHTIKVIPYSLGSLQGEIGTSYEVTLTFVAPTSPPPTSPPPTSPPPTSPPPTSPPPTSPPTSNTVKVNFQPSGAPTVSGAVVDSGTTYASQNGYTYGWTTSHTGMVVDREINADQALDTHVGVIAKAKWDFAVPNGTYTVKVSVGDAAAATSNNVWVEGKNNIFIYEKTAANEFKTATTTVNVVDGNVTLGVGGSPTGATRINYVEITGQGLVGTVPPTSPPPTSPPPTSPPPTSPPPTSPPPTSPPPTSPPPTSPGSVKVNFQPTTAPSVSGYVVDGGALFGSQSGYSYGWTTSHADTVVDRNANSNQLLDTNVAVKALSKWELAVPNGTYTVKISVGDAVAGSKNNVWVEGTSNIFKYLSLGANQFQTQTTTVSVFDGRLTLGFGGTTTGDTRINFIEVTPQ